MNSIQLFDPASSTYTYVLFDPATRDALIIDSVAEQLQRDLGILKESHLRLVWVLETALHADHVSGAAALVAATGARLAVPVGCGIEGAGEGGTRQLNDGDTIALGQETLRVLHTPGHTAASVCFLYVGAPVPDMQTVQSLFSGNTLLIGDCGRTDLPTSDAGALYDTITQKLFALHPATCLWPGHDFHERGESTIALERATNAVVMGRTRAQFIETMSTRAWPRLYHPDAVMASNRRAGARDQGQQAMTEATAPDKSAEVTPAEDYAGDITPQVAYAWAQAGKATLVDVRSDAERQWVGFVPEAKAVAWKQWPGMVMNPAFDEQIKTAAASALPLVVLCQTGGRAKAAAKRATELGLTAYRITGGFEGSADENGQRGHKTGWRSAGLPWQQK